MLIASQFHSSIVRALVRGATGVLRRQGAASSQIRLLWAPGAFELPVIAARVARTRPRPHAIIALGTLIRGETLQYEVLAHAVAQGLSQVAVDTQIPVTFGIVVATTRAQAEARSGGALRNRGEEAAMAALATLRLFERIQ